MAASILAISLRWRSRALKLERALGLGGRPVGDIGVLRRIVMQVLEGFLGRAEDLVPPVEQFPAEIGPLAIAHERFVFRWAIIFGDFSFGARMVISRRIRFLIGPLTALLPLYRLAHFGDPTGQPRIYGSEFDKSRLPVAA